MADVNITPTAMEMLQAIPDGRIRRKISDAIDVLEDHPESGKPLTRDLQGYRRLKISRYRAVYHYEAATDEATVEAIGIRKSGSKRDIYNIAVRLLGDS